ncbi:MAG: HAD family hydrolase [Thermoplasmata archaeon]|nr:HAD family hydrolase [Thermoplasmata archaeon]
MPAITIDLWHTLIYLEPAAEEAYMDAQAGLAAHALAIAPRGEGSPTLSEKELAGVFEDFLAEAVAEAARGRTVTVVEQLARAGQSTGRAPDAGAYLVALEEMVNGTPFLTAPGAEEMLGALHDDGYRLGVISNTVGEPGRFLRPVLHGLGLDRSIDALVFSDEHPWTKPAPEIFHAALTELGQSASAAVHVGDGWSDIEGSRRAGYRASILYSGLQEYGPKYRALFAAAPTEGSRPNHVVSRLAEIRPLVHRLLPPPTHG